MKNVEKYNAVKYLFFISICLLFINGCAAHSRHKKTSGGVSSAKESAVKELCVSHRLHCQWDGISQTVSMDIDGLKIKALVGSAVVLVNTEKILLNKPFIMADSRVMAPADFKEKVIDKFLSKTAAVTAASMPLDKTFQIIIDAGHGGKDPGALSRGGLKEKEVNIDIARRVQKILEKNGIKVIMTRKTDVFISLAGRTEMASQLEADMFVSIHANSNQQRSVQGMEMYISKDLEKLDKIEEQRQKNEKLLFKALNMKRTETVEEIVSDMLYAHKQSESAVLAAQMAKEISQKAGTPYRGLKHARFFVLRNTLIPAVLVEVGYLTNAKEEKLLASSDYRQKVAQGIASGIIKYVKN